MKYILLLTISCMVSSMVHSQYENEPSEANPYGLPNPDAPKEITDYEKMIGTCDCLSVKRNSDGTWADTADMTWVFKYIMNGLAVQDQGIKSTGSIGGSIRQYNADSSKWYVHYYSSAAAPPKLGVWEGGNVDSDIILYKDQPAPNGTPGKFKITFYDITDEGFNWKGEWVDLSETIIYPTWTIQCKKRTN